MESMLSSLSQVASYRNTDVDSGMQGLEGSHEGKRVAQNLYKTDLVQSLYLLIFKCGLLARMMVKEEFLSHDAMRQATAHLLSLCNQDLCVLYLLGHEPIDGSCPLKCCRLKLSR